MPVSMRFYGYCGQEIMTKHLEHQFSNQNHDQKSGFLGLEKGIFGCRRRENGISQSSVLLVNRCSSTRAKNFRGDG